MKRQNNWLSTDRRMAISWYTAFLVLIERVLSCSITF